MPLGQRPRQEDSRADRPDCQQNQRHVRDDGLLRLARTGRVEADAVPRKRLAHGFDENRSFPIGDDVDGAPRTVAAECDERGKRHQKLRGRRQPYPIAKGGTLVLQCEGNERGKRGKQRGLPEMVPGEGEEFTDREGKGAHRGFSFFDSLRISCSASCTSSSVSLPVSTRWATTGCGRPPKKLSRSSMRRRCAALREMAASKMCALPIFLSRRIAFFVSSRYTIVCTVV